MMSNKEMQKSTKREMQGTEGNNIQGKYTDIFQNYNHIENDRRRKLEQTKKVVECSCVD